MLQAEFLGMVSHELQAPLTSTMGSAATVPGACTALRPAETLQFFRIIDEQADQMRELIGDLLERMWTGPGRAGKRGISTGSAPSIPDGPTAATLRPARRCGSRPRAR